MDAIKPVWVVRDPDRERAEASEERVVAVGAQFPDSGDIVVEWNREAFEEGNRAGEAVGSRYRNVADAEQATRGTVVFEEPDAEVSD